MSLEEATKLVRSCVDQLAKRFLVNLPAFSLNVVDKDGVREIEF